MFYLCVEDRKFWLQHPWSLLGWSAMQLEFASEADNQRPSGQWSEVLQKGRVNAHFFVEEIAALKEDPDPVRSGFLMR